MRLSAIPSRYGCVSLCGCLAKGRSKRVDTAVGRYVEKHAPRLARKIARRMSAFGKATAQRISKRYAELVKGDEDLVHRILRILNARELSEQIEGEIGYALRQAYKRQAVAGLQQVGFPVSRAIVEQMDERALEWAGSHGGQLIKNLSTTTINDVQRVLMRGVEEGLAPDALSELIEGLGAFSPARAEMIARTELAFAHVQGNVEGWRESGEVVGKRWLLGDLHAIDDVCDDCVDAGQVDLDAEFVDGVAFPPAHPNCICDVEPVLRESGGDNEE